MIITDEAIEAVAELYAEAEDSGSLETAKEALQAASLHLKWQPHVVASDDELFELPVGTVIKDRDGDIVQRFRDGWRATINEDHGEPWLTDTLEVDLPATVLHEPS